MGQGREAEGIPALRLLPLRQGGWRDQPLPTTPKGLGKEKLSAPLGSQRVLGGSIKILVFWVSDLHRNAAAPPGILRGVGPS